MNRLILLSLFLLAASPSYGQTPAFSVNKGGSDQGVTNGANPPTWVTWSTELFDTTNNFDTSTGKSPPNVAGKYYFSASLYCPLGNQGVSAWIYKTGTAAIMGYPAGNASNTSGPIAT